MLFKMMNRLKKEEKGFTLIELLAVIVILAVIAAIAVPYILGVIEKSKKDADIATFHQVYEAARLYVTSENVDITTSATILVNKDLITKKYLESGIKLPSNKVDITNGKVVYTNGTLSSITLTTGSDTGAASWSLTGPEVIGSTGTKTTVATPYIEP
ncbi:type II secretion system protein [Paenibacillus anseongense]|uniref:pilus assembly FimT family protein n=1 Tax=Paenibacillus anseongense TaxID=2682845 RepID=UPI002DBB0B6C|nr:type II secretion system protein [Paenibacillus anseongense]MEC0270145.1 type II secretion system protein [Paenibacillus anseongense]